MQKAKKPNVKVGSTRYHQNATSWYAPNKKEGYIQSIAVTRELFPAITDTMTVF